MFWDAFSSADVALLERGFYVAFIDAGDTFASSAALKLFDALTISLRLSTAFPGVQRSKA